MTASLDRDGDGVLDGQDNCADDPNPTQGDTDNDGSGDPLGGDTFNLCVYDANGFVTSGVVRGGGLCGAKNPKPCWKESVSSYKFKDSERQPNGVLKALFKEGLVPGKSKAIVAGKGETLSDFDLAAVTGTVVVQLINSATGACLASGFDEPFSTKRPRSKPRAAPRWCPWSTPRGTVVCYAPAVAASPRCIRDCT